MEEEDEPEPRALLADPSSPTSDLSAGWEQQDGDLDAAEGDGTRASRLEAAIQYSSRANVEFLSRVFEPEDLEPLLPIIDTSSGSQVARSLIQPLAAEEAGEIDLDLDSIWLGEEEGGEAVATEEGEGWDEALRELMGEPEMGDEEAVAKLQSGQASLEETIRAMMPASVMEWVDAETSGEGDVDEDEQVTFFNYRAACMKHMVLTSSPLNLDSISSSGCTIDGEAGQDVGDG